MTNANRPGLDQRGQATIFALALLGVVILAAIFLFQSGRLTSEKMQLQNGADAAAYSASLLEARAMNFCAYTNQAMVANEVSIGQMVGILSWIDEVKVIGENISVVGDILDATVIFAELGAPLNAIGDSFIEVGESLNDALLPILTPAIEAISVINEVYSVSQQVYYLATLALESKAIVQTLKDNVPGTPNSDITKRIINLGGDEQYNQGARLSAMGLLALAGHFPSYVSGFTKRYALSAEGSSEDNKEGMGRFAATVRGGRDPFSSGDRSQRVPVRDSFSRHTTMRDEQTRDWLFGLTVDTPSLYVAPGVKVTAGMSMDMESYGGSELVAKDDGYGWAAVDTAALAAKARASVRVHLGPLHWHKSISKKISVPAGGGGYQANNGQHSLSVGDVASPDGASPKPYGNAKDHLLSWEEATLSVEENQISEYGGLRPYRDVATGDDGFDYPFKAPHFLVAVIRPMADIEGKGPQFSDIFDLPRLGADEPYKSFNNALGALAKAEVYFARPDDLSYFARKDGKSENANLFSPFWQARLVKSSNFDRFLTLALQHMTLWIELPDGDDIPDGHDIIEALKNFLESLI